MSALAGSGPTYSNHQNCWQMQGGTTSARRPAANGAPGRRALRSAFVSNFGSCYKLTGRLLEDGCIINSLSHRLRRCQLPQRGGLSERWRVFQEAAATANRGPTIIPQNPSPGNQKAGPIFRTRFLLCLDGTGTIISCSSCRKWSCSPQRPAR